MMIAVWMIGLVVAGLARAGASPTPLHGFVTMGNDLKPDALALALSAAILTGIFGAIAYNVPGGQKAAGAMLRGCLTCIVVAGLVSGSMIPWVQTYI